MEGKARRSRGTYAAEGPSGAPVKPACHSRRKLAPVNRDNEGGLAGPTAAAAPAPAGVAPDSACGDADSVESAAVAERRSTSVDGSVAVVEGDRPPPARAAAAAVAAAASRCRVALPILLKILASIPPASPFTPPPPPPPPPPLPLAPPIIGPASADAATDCNKASSAVTAVPLLTLARLAASDPNTRAPTRAQAW